MKLASAKKIAAYTRKGWWGRETFYDLFTRVAKARPGAPATVDPPDRETFLGDSPKRFDWRQLSDLTERYAAVFTQAGLRRSDVVVMQCPNIVEAVAVYLAAAKIGVVVSPLPVQYAGYELGYVIKAVNPKAVIAASRFKDRHLAKACRDVAGAGVIVFAIGPDAGVDGLVDLNAEAASVSLRKGPLGVFGAASKQEGEANDAFTIAWTSGTTGTPKGVPRSHNHWLAIAPATFDAMAVQPGERLLNPFPLTNMAAIGGMFASWLLSGGVLVLHHPFELPVFLAQLAEEEITATIAPPAVLTLLLKQGDLLDQFDLSKLRVIGSGSAPLSEFMVAGWKDRGVEIVNLFGSNEGVSLASGPREAPEPAKRASWFPRFGHPGADFSNRMHERLQTKLVSLETGKPVDQPGEEGELLVKGPAVFEGYYGDTGEARDEVFDSEGYFRTGDLFMIAPEDENFLVFKGRAKDIIIRGGVNVSAAELDTLLDGHPKIVEAAVFGMPDEVMGERIWVAVVVKDGETASLEEVIDWLTAKDIAKYKLPEKLVLVEALPRNAMNKILRWKLREMAEAEPA
ncbi:class I adenylate-forming enzyme family protein [Oceanicaulis alexandrii]|uniref:class I adenylate-forming enzyme family protein n=1 Tax=Oceanicaulis alexandrii TaxID=153233 RepID=UPI0003B3E16E|nr:class I adenylate-forming enzyme family protein [Oceanicaulis alexandrii]